MTATTMTATTPCVACLLDNWELTKETTAASSQVPRNSNRDNTKLFRSRAVQAKIYIARHHQEFKSVEVENLPKDA